MTKLLVFFLSIIALTDVAQAQYSEIGGRKVPFVMLARVERYMVPRNMVTKRLSPPALETCGSYFDRIIASDGKTPMIRFFYRLDDGQVVEEAFRPSVILAEESFIPWSFKAEENHPRVKQEIVNGSILVTIRGNSKMVSGFRACSQ